MGIACGVCAEALSTQPNVATCSITALPGLSAQYARATRAGHDARGGSGNGDRTLTPGGASDFWRVTASVLRLDVRRDEPASSGRTSVDGVGLPSLAALPCDRAVRARDRIAWSMGMVGYSAREIAE